MSKLLVVCDYQNDFVDGSLGFPAAKTLEDGIYNKIIQSEELDDEIVFLLDTHDEKYLHTKEGKALPTTHCVEGTHGHEVYGKIAPLSKRHLKFTKISFGSPKLYRYLQTGDYDCIEFVGLVTNICVLENALLAQTVLPNAKIIVDASCVSSYDADLHEKALDVMAGMQINVINR